MSAVAKLRTTILAITGLSIVLVFLAPAQAAFADYCSGSYRGRDGCQGYFSGDASSLGGVDDLISGGTSAMSAKDFTDQIDTALSGNHGQNSVGAAFIIANSFGKDGTDFSSQSDGETWARGKFNEWKALITAYEAAGYIDWSKSVNTATASDMSGGSGEYRNSAWFGDIDDSAFHNKNDETITVIEIVIPGGGYFRMERKCLNLVGKLTKLETLEATIDPQSLVNGKGDNTVVVDASSGSTVFEHRIRVTNYRGMNHDVEYRVERSINNDETCNAPYVIVPGSAGTLSIKANGTFTVWGPADVPWNRDTTSRVCQRLRITDRDDANLTGSNPAERWATVRSGTVSFGVSSSPSGIIEPGAPFSMDGWVNAQPAAGNSFPLTYNISYTSGVPGLSAPVAKSQTVNVSAPFSDSNPFNGTIPLNAPAGTEICVTASVSSPTQDRYFSTPARSDAICLKVVYKPVFHVNGGDITAGASVDTGACGPGPDSLIAGWNINVAPYTGAGSRFSAFATDVIKAFATAREVTGASAPSGLAFANTIQSGEDYGGFYGRVPCIVNHWVPAPSGTPSIAPDAVGSGAPGIYRLSGNTINTARVVANGVQQIVYVDGDLTITNNITYNRSGWVKRQDVPAVKFVVSGNIIIHGSVTALDGVYAAAGNIETCQLPPDGSMYAGCDKRLVVNGALISSSTTGGIYFKRTFGSVRTATAGNAAEEINYRPEMWIAKWPQQEGANTSSGKYDSITALPPVL